MAFGWHDMSVSTFRCFVHIGECSAFPSIVTHAVSLLDIWKQGAQQAQHTTTVASTRTEVDQEEDHHLDLDS